MAMATRSIFLAFYDPAGAPRYVEISDGGNPVTDTKMYLPRTVGEDINLARKAPNASSYVELGSLASSAQPAGLTVS